MAYFKGVSVSIRRRPDLFVLDTEIENSGYLSDFSLSSVEELVIELNELISSMKGGMYWGQEKIMIQSAAVISICYDEVNEKELPHVKTHDLLNLMKEIKLFKQHYQNPTNLKKIIDEAFAMIKTDPINHRRYPSSDAFYAVTINDIYITLTLKSEDFNLTVKEYVNQLNTNF